MTKQLPKYNETFIPILDVLGDGRTRRYGELKKEVRDRYYSDLPADQLRLETRSGVQLILNRIGWGVSYLKRAELIKQPQRAVLEITDKGQAALERGAFTLNDLKNDPDYNRNERQQKESLQANDGDYRQNKADFELSPQDMIDSGIQQIESQTKGDLLEKLKSSDPYRFERVVLELFQKMGYGDFLETPKSADGGIDGIINQDELGLEKIYVQAKRYGNNKVREPDIRNFIGAMSGDTPKGIFVTTSSFDNNAVAKARAANHKIILVDGDRLANLMYRHGIGVQLSSSYEVKELDEDYFE